MTRNRGFLAFTALIAGSTALLALIIADTAGAQDSPVSITPRLSRGSANRLTPNIRVDTNLVLVPVLVTDRDNRLVTGLKKEYFQLFDEKIEQEITQFSTDDTPLSVMLVFDCSSSMGDKLRKSRLAVSEFLKTANAEDEFGLVQFADRAQVISKFSDRMEELQNRLAFLPAKGRTALLDGVYLAMNEMRHAKYGRKAILIISDGGDNSSRYSEREVKERAREADIQIYSMGIMEPLTVRGRTPEEMSGAALLDDISHMTGGRMYEVNDINDLPGIAAQLSRSLRYQYVLGYSPASPPDGKYHRITVKLLPMAGFSRLRATFRPSYLSPEPLTE